MPAFQDLTGQTFERLTVLSLSNRGKGGVRWEVRCLCGVIKVVSASALKQRLTKSCGCLRNEKAAARGRAQLQTHGMSNTPTFICWDAMLQRCGNPKHAAFPNYGARGITVCRRWRKFENFFSDMGTRPESKELDRIDNDGDYTLENCRWATRKRNSRNRRSNRTITLDGETYCLAEWGEIRGMTPGKIGDRLRYGWTEREAVFGKDH